LISSQSHVVVFGGYGTFGSLVAIELARLGFAVTVAGRDPVRGERAVLGLGKGHRFVQADLTDPRSCRQALDGQSVAAVCAGPFSVVGAALLEACLEKGCHYVDIADDREYVRRVMTLNPRFSARRCTAVFGCSSLPGLSGALALHVRRRCSDPPQRARVTLFIGNDNPKGTAAIRSAVGVVGRTVKTPQGVLKGFREGERVPLPAPFGPRRAFTFDAPDYDLLPVLLGVHSVSVKVAFESRLATGAFAFLAALGLRYGEGTSSALAWIGRGTRGGSSGGAVMAELWWPDGGEGRACLLATRDGQRMAALPCAWAVEALLNGNGAPGVLAAYELLEPRVLLGRLAEAGYPVVVG